MVAKRALMTGFVVCVLLLVLGSSGSGLADAARATSPAAQQGGLTIPYAGRLAGPDGKAIPDGAYDFSFALYDAATGRTALWTETQTGVSVKGGEVNATLGKVTPLSETALASKLRYLEVSVRGPGEANFTILSPRQTLMPGVPASPNVLDCPHSHFTDYWGGTGSSSYGLEVDNTAGTGDGVRGYSGATLYNYAGVYAVNGGGTAGGGDGGSGVYGYSGNGYGGYFESGTYRALYAKGAPAWYAAFIVNPSGAANTGLYVDGTIFVTGGKAGFVTDVALNDGPEPLETGDVVVITGADAPLAGENPVIRVRRATAADSTAVAGVVDQAIVMQQGPQDAQAIPGVIGHEAHLADNTAIQPGQYLMIVTLGAYKGVKVDATSGPIHMGDLLVASGTAGYAATSADAKLGTVIGKALGDLKSGTGLIPVMVTLK
jgi:hypothetical protein